MKIISDGYLNPDLIHATGIIGFGGANWKCEHWTQRRTDQVLHETAQA